MSVIEVEDLHKTYPGGVEALRGIDFHIEEGEIFGLLGPNGAGKSTAVRILVTLSTPTRGRAKVAGCDVMKDPQGVRRQLGYVAQVTGMSQMQLATGRELLSLQGQLFGIKGRELRQRVDELLEKFGLADAARRVIRGYSGGMRRRLDVACGLINRPRILFLDEPTTGLDPESRNILWREIELLAKEGGLTILLTTHYLEEADRLANRLTIVDRGKVVAEGTSDELKSSLEGDRLTVELVPEADDDAGAGLLAGLEWTTSEVVREERLLHVQVRDGARAVPAIVSAFDGAGLKIAQVSLSRPTLDDVYLRMTGRSFDETDAVANPPQPGQEPRRA